MFCQVFLHTVVTNTRNRHSCINLLVQRNMRLTFSYMPFGTLSCADYHTLILCRCRLSIPCIISCSVSFKRITCTILLISNAAGVIKNQWLVAWVTPGNLHERTDKVERELDRVHSYLNSVSIQICISYGKY